MDYRKIYDFSNCPLGDSSYGGANGKKIPIIINDEEFMLKFPSDAKHNTNLHYSNGTASEFLGSHIFDILGIESQETYLGVYKLNGKSYDVVACKDFTEQGKYSFYDFGSLKNRVITSSGEGYGTDLQNVIESLEKQSIFDERIIKGFFFDMLAVDALIANFDRHNGNWGYLKDNITKEKTIAPIFDCGSSLYPQADDETKKKIMTDKQELNARINSRPLSVFKMGASKIPYGALLKSGIDPELDYAVNRIGGRIHERMQEIKELILNAPLQDKDKEFYSFIIGKRKERIIDVAMREIDNKDRERRKRSFLNEFSMITPKSHGMSR